MSRKPLPQVPVKTGIRFKEPKKCNCCGSKYDLMPKDAPFVMGMYWFDCPCKSTLCATEDMIHE